MFSSNDKFMIILFICLQSFVNTPSYWNFRRNRWEASPWKIHKLWCNLGVFAIWYGFFYFVSCIILDILFVKTLPTEVIIFYISGLSIILLSAIFAWFSNRSIKFIIEITNQHLELDAQFRGLKITHFHLIRF